MLVIWIIAYHTRFLRRFFNIFLAGTPTVCYALITTIQRYLGKEADLMSHPQHCPGCGNRCSLDAPSCTTGERYARSLRAAHHHPTPPAEAKPAAKKLAAAPKAETLSTPRPKRAAQKTAPTAIERAPLSLEDRLALQLRVLERTMERNQPNQKSGQSRLLTLLAAQPEGQLTQRALMEHMGIRSSSLSELVHKLERSGLVQRAECPADRRTALVSLTEQGRAKAAGLSGAETTPFRVLSTAEQETLLTLLTKLNKDEG